MCLRWTSHMAVPDPAWEKAQAGRKSAVRVLGQRDGAWLADCAHSPRRFSLHLSSVHPPESKVLLKVYRCQPPVPCAFTGPNVVLHPPALPKSLKPTQQGSRTCATNMRTPQGPSYRFVHKHTD